ncbi:hypothetical protein SETIT_9G241900v2 [Setaria italica]|uniref:Expansin n=1 Tax=Setaria italica TaxID=4555 RepID=K4AM00_SETIT|nr:hypothetical protein SETIT_9G241900v2 [Setaria italica]
MANSLMLCTVVAACLALAAADWSPGTATFYGGVDGSGTMGGACGYDNLYNAGYGVNNAALSTTLFNDGASCGQCYLITCDGSRPGASVGAGIVPVLYQRVQCSRTGGVRFSMAGSNYFLLVNIQNLGGSGSVGAAWVKGDRTGWIQMSRNWGANWQALAGLVGQGLSFAVTSTGGQYIQFLNVVPGWWQFGMAFSTNQNFVY